MKNTGDNMAASKKDRIRGYKYIGGGFVFGVPARDLDGEEAKMYGDLIADEERKSNTKLYEAQTAQLNDEGTSKE